MELRHTILIASTAVMIPRGNSRTRTMIMNHIAGILPKKIWVKLGSPGNYDPIFRALGVKLNYNVFFPLFSALRVSAFRFRLASERL